MAQQQVDAPVVFMRDRVGAAAQQRLIMLQAVRAQVKSNTGQYQNYSKNSVA
jgi:hypothetical protein